MEGKMSLLIKLVQQGLFLGMVFSILLLLIQASNAKATVMEFTNWASAVTNENAIAPNGGTGTPFNTNANTGGAGTFTFYPTTTNDQSLNAIYSTTQGSITSDITTQSNISPTTGEITLSHAVSITNSFPSSLDYGVGGYSFVNVQNAFFIGNGSEITLPISFSANFSNTGTVNNGNSTFGISISSNTNANFASYTDNNFSTGSGLLTDLTFPTIAGGEYSLFAYSQLSGDVLGNARVDLTIFIGPPQSQSLVSATPEPPTFWLMATGILGMFGWVGYRKVRASA